MKSDANKSGRIEEQEPKSSVTAAPVFIFIVLALLLYWAVLYLDQNAGGFNQLVYAPYKSVKQLPVIGNTNAEAGRKIYMASCSPCHQANGLGMTGQFPPLAGSEWVTPDVPARAIRIVLDGATGPMEVKGAQYNNTMVPWRESLSDKDIAAVLTFVRSEWGNKAPAVTAEQVKAIRDATTDHANRAWTSEELLKVPDAQ